ncbi:MAG: exodeoxyribonuclease VII small subunit [Actinobacteria bacterium]|nr:MAG: exodeoxyribonuclease VII small subunit [Actinomycetota bacterium]
MTDTPQLPDPDTMDYEAARDELVGIVRQLESGQAPLEATINLWERGEALANRCRTILSSAQKRLEETSTLSSEVPEGD